ncbi:GNAT domain-containing protein [Coprinopsis sp. MPI-PUGE-AT-0042]|nr:GNAT domain-containing protein [Coprinopsis sp. MPI-PUGE-AT-0042]
MSELVPLPAPLQRNPKSGEIFLRLRKHSNIILTPPRASDAEKITEHLQDPKINSWLVSPPVPYKLEHAHQWLSFLVPQRHEAVKELEDACAEAQSNGGTPKYVRSCPFNFLRVLNEEDWTDELIGSFDVTLHHSATPEEDIWTIGDWLASSYHGQGIMSDTVQTVLQDWIIPRMNAQKVLGEAFTDNVGSIRVFEKNGFKTTTIKENAQNVRGVMKGLHTLTWTPSRE